MFATDKDFTLGNKIINLIVNEEFPNRAKKLNKILLNQFDNEKTFSGSKWVELEKRTRNDRKREGYNPKHPILKREGTLRDSIKFSWDGKSLEQHNIKDSIDSKIADISRGLQKKRPHTDLHDTYYPGGKDYNKFIKKIAKKIINRFNSKGVDYWFK